MLVKETLQKQIEVAMYNAMKNALIEMGKAMQDAANGSVDDNGNSSFSPDVAIEKFANEAKKCSVDIANAIDSYIKSATITINMGTVITPIPTLVSPAGPVTGVITLATPTVLTNSIK